MMLSGLLATLSNKCDRAYLRDYSYFTTSLILTQVGRLVFRRCRIQIDEGRDRLAFILAGIMVKIKLSNYQYLINASSI